MRHCLPGEPRTPRDRDKTGVRDAATAARAQWTAPAALTGRRLLTGGWRTRTSTEERLRCQWPAPEGWAHRFPAPSGPLGSPRPARRACATWVLQGSWKKGSVPPEAERCLTVDTPQPCRPWMTLSQNPLKRRPAEGVPVCLVGASGPAAALPALTAPPGAALRGLLTAGRVQAIQKPVAPA